MSNARNKRSLTIDKHRTSVSLEEPFWTALADIAREEGKSIAGLVSEIDKTRKGTSLSAAIRLHVLERARARSGAS